MGSLDFDAEKTTFREYYDSNLPTLQGCLNSFKTLIDSLLKALPDIAISSIDGRIKDREECVSKFTRKYRTELESSKTPYTIREKISDIIGLRVVCLYEDDVERIKEAISKEFDVIYVTDKIAQIEGTEASFGYKGLHLDLRLTKTRREMAEYRLYADHSFELQIRTVVQDSWSIVDHKIKYKKSIPNSLKRRINTLAALFELADREFRSIRDDTSAELAQAEDSYPEIEKESDASDDPKTNTAKQRGSIEPGQYAPLNAFYALRCAKHFFPEFEFEPHKVDGFTQDVVSLKPGISRGKFNFYLRNSIGQVKRYQAEFEKNGDTMNPYTVMRHCLYAGDPRVFATILTDSARERFDRWVGSNGK